MRDLAPGSLFNHVHKVDLIVTLTTLFACETNAFARREAQYPNHQCRCVIYLQTPSGEGTRTSLGEDIKNFGTEGGSISRFGFCDRDSDGNGLTNGQELGDPDRTWILNHPAPEALVTDPNDPMSSSIEVDISILLSIDMPTNESAAGEEISANELAASENNTNDSTEDEGFQVSTHRGRAMWLIPMCLTLNLSTTQWLT